MTKKSYELLPLLLSPERAQIVSRIMRGVASHETAFSDFLGTCEANCVSKEQLPAMCKTCIARMQMVARVLGRPDSRAFEVWHGEEISGIIYFSDINPGNDALGHYVFFDGRLADKVDVMHEAMDTMYEELELRRLTIEVPASFAALARHASKRLGFGGAYDYVLRERVDDSGRRSRDVIQVEGVKRDAVMWRGKATDLLILGRLRTAS